METFYAPAERTDRLTFDRQIESVSNSPVISALLKAMSGLLAVVNQDRQIVALNHDFLKAFRIENPEAALGLRLGESVNCVHASEKPAGCGTTPHCATCGAVIAMMTCITSDRPDERICALKARMDGEEQDLCLLVKTHPLILDGYRWILVFARDISQEQAWINMERVFFHDINNILSGALGNSQLLAMRYPDDKNATQTFANIQRLCSEILLQRTLSINKDPLYILQKTRSSLSAIRAELTRVLSGNRALAEKHLDETWPLSDVEIETDPLLVVKVLTNMLINAFEATEKGGTVRLTVSVDNPIIEWEIWNQTPIPEPVRHRIFQRYFSTKNDPYRGIGTYSMKLIGETYLGGSVHFTSSEEDGTRFFLKLQTSVDGG